MERRKSKKLVRELAIPGDMLRLVRFVRGKIERDGSEVVDCGGITICRHSYPNGTESFSFSEKPGEVLYRVDLHPEGSDGWLQNQSLLRIMGSVGPRRRRKKMVVDTEKRHPTARIKGKGYVVDDFWEENNVGDSELNRITSSDVLMVLGM